MKKPGILAAGMPRVTGSIFDPTGNFRPKNLNCQGTLEVFPRLLSTPMSGGQIEVGRLV